MRVHSNSCYHLLIIYNCLLTVLSRSAYLLRRITNPFCYVFLVSIIAENLNSEKSLITDFPLSASHFSYDETSRTRVLVSIEKITLSMRCPVGSLLHVYNNYKHEVLFSLQSSVFSSQFSQFSSFVFLV